MPGYVLVLILLSLLVGGAAGLFVGRLIGYRAGQGDAETGERQWRKRVEHLENERDTLKRSADTAAAVPGPSTPPEADAPSPVAESGMAGVPHSDTYPAPDTPATEETDTEAGGGPGDAARPPLLDGPQGGKADDLKAINGIGPKLETALNDTGIFHYRQIAELNAEQVAWLDNALNLRGRIGRDDWVGQAKTKLGEG